MFFTFNIAKGDTVEAVKVPINENWKRFALYRNMVADLGELEDGLELNIINNDNPIHQNAYEFIIRLCTFLDNNEITDKNWEDSMSVTSTIEDSTLAKHIHDLVKELSDSSKNKDDHITMFHDILRIINFTECDNNQSSPYVLEILCCYYATHILHKKE